MTFEPCDGLSAPLLHRDADGHVTVEWEGRRGYLRQTLFSDNMVDEYAKTVNELVDARAALKSLYDATGNWAANSYEINAARSAAGVVLGGDNDG